jgi:hypothetical protein
MNDEVLAILTAAWIQALSARHNEEGYTDAGAGHEAARLAVDTYGAIQFFKAKAPK